MAENIVLGTLGTERMRVTGTGNIGIGTTTPQHLLSVAGTIWAQEVVVVSSGADYVFEPEYRLAPLGEVSDYIKANHHLPEIPSAAEVGEKGVNLFNSLLTEFPEPLFCAPQSRKLNSTARSTARN